MAATYTKTVNFTNSNPSGGEDYYWQNLDSNATWVTRSAGANANEWDFTIQDNTASNATTRSTTWKVFHHSYTTDDDTNTWAAFTITQYADGSSKVTPTVATTQPTAATTQPTAATTQPTAATTQPTSATAATTQPTSATTQPTAATTQPTAATTQPTAATTQPTAATTQKTAATTQPTAATTTQARTISWTSGNKTVTSGGQSFLLQAAVNSDAVAGNMPSITYKSSGGGGAGQMYWAADASGSTPISAPSWITNGSGGTFNNSGLVNLSVSIDPYN
jgi:hypothetical protein